MNNAPGDPLASIHVVMLAQYLPLHFVSTMQKLSHKVGRLTMLLSEPMDSSRDWAPDFSGLEVKIQRSLHIGVKHRHPLGFQERGKLIVPYSTITDLARLRPDVVIAVEVGPRTVQAALLKKLGASFKLIVQVRESENTAQSRGPARKRLRRWLLPRVDGVFVNGESGRRHVLECGVSPGKITVVPSGTDTTLFGSTARVMPRGDELQLLYVGQLIPRKGVVPFARALAAAARETGRYICWTIAGRGPQADELRQVEWPANVRLNFLGPQPYRDLPKCYAGADAFVMPSLSDEWGLVVNEAMASGLPVLGCTGSQAVEELVVGGVSGWTYSPGDTATLRRELLSLLATPRSQLAEMGSVARRRALAVSDEHTASAMIYGIERALTPSEPSSSITGRLAPS